MIPITYNVRSLFVRRTTTLATLLGIALVVFVLSSSQMLARGVQKTMGRSGSSGNAIVLRKGSDAELASNFDANLVNLIKAAPGVAKDESGASIVSGEVVLVIAADLLKPEGQVANVLVRGVPGDVTKLRREVRIVEGRPAKPGTEEVIVGKRAMGRYKRIALGSTFELNKNRPVKIVGLFEAGGSSFESEIWVDIDVARAAFGREGLVSSASVHLESPTKFDAFAAAMEHDKQLGLLAMRENAYYEKQSENTSIFVSALGTSIVFFFSIGAMIGAMITMYSAVANRRREIGTMRALGFSRTAILISFLLEASLLALMGGALGAAASLAMGAVRFTMMNFATWSEVVFSFEPAPDILAGATLVGGLMGLIGGFFPAVRAARTSPLAAMRD
jgi:putative ABC transport system permease protein